MCSDLCQEEEGRRKGGGRKRKGKGGREEEGRGRWEGGMGKREVKDSIINYLL